MKWSRGDEVVSGYERDAVRLLDRVKGDTVGTTDDTRCFIYSR